MEIDPASSRAHAVPKAVRFDACGSWFDVYGATALAETLFPGFAERLSLLWRGQQVNRAGLPIEQLDTEATHAGNSLRAVLSFFPQTPTR